MKPFPPPPIFSEIFGKQKKPSKKEQTEEEKAKEWVRRKYGGLYPRN